jgi:hypothetical protein
MWHYGRESPNGDIHDPHPRVIEGEWAEGGDARADAILDFDDDELDGELLVIEYVDSDD